MVDPSPSGSSTGKHASVRSRRALVQRELARPQARRLGPGSSRWQRLPSRLAIFAMRATLATRMPAQVARASAGHRTARRARCGARSGPRVPTRVRSRPLPPAVVIAAAACLRARLIQRSRERRTRRPARQRHKASRGRATPSSRPRSRPPAPSSGGERRFPGRRILSCSPLGDSPSASRSPRAAMAAGILPCWRSSRATQVCALQEGHGSSEITLFNLNVERATILREIVRSRSAALGGKRHASKERCA